MIHRRLVVPVLALTLISAAACRRDPPPPPEPAGPTQAELERMRQDSIRAAEAARAQAEAAAREREAAEQRRLEEARASAVATLREIVHFDYDQSDINPQAERVLRQKVEILRANPGIRLRIEGHADERGSTEYNLALANRRAESVRQFFTNFGLSGDRFATVSYGEERPLVNRSDEQAWAQNRRAEFVITAGDVRVPSDR
ncbi:MAG: OmpA family protein [Gemmatimonadetes bacterium]|nr:OmpA family protein [Gemmatimonadota bacterium]